LDIRALQDQKISLPVDGRLVGDIGEMIAELEYDLTLDEVSAPNHDA